MYRRTSLIILQGHPCTGKTALLSQLREKLRLPTVSRDELKELLFDQLGVRDREWSMELGRTSYELFFKVTEELFYSGKSFVIESNFNPVNHREWLAGAIRKHDYTPIEIILEADPKVLMSRFRHRWESGERHRGHVDHERYRDLEQRLQEGKLEPLSLGGKILRIDTSDFGQVDWSDLLTTLESLTS